MIIFFVTVCLGAIAAGTVLGWTSNIPKKLKNDHDLNGIIISEDDFGWIGSLSTIGAMIMCFTTGILCDVIGRKWGCLLQALPFTLGWILVTWSSNIGMIFAGRFFTGLASGAFCVAAPLYASEIADKNNRGTLGTFFQLLLTVGILIAYIGGAYLTSKNLSILCLIIPIVFAVVFFFQPETPVYYVKKNKDSEALATLRKFRGSDYDCESELKEIKATLQNNDQKGSSFFQVLITKAGLKSCFICFCLMFFQQFSGVNAIIFYTSSIFAEAKSSLDDASATIIVGVMQVVATFVASLLIDRFGRKILLLCSVIFMMLSGFVMAIFFTLQLKGNDVSSITFLPILCVVVFISSFSIGFGPIPWMIAAELLPAEIKSIISSAAATFNWFLAFLITKFYADAVNSVGQDVTFYVFSAICLIGTVFVFLVVPETKGKTLLEVQAMLNGEKRFPDREGINNPNFKQ